MSLYPRRGGGKSRLHIERRLRGFHSRSRQFEEEKILLILPRIEPQSLGHPARNLATHRTNQTNHNTECTECHFCDWERCNFKCHRHWQVRKCPLPVRSLCYSTQTINSWIIAITSKEITTFFCLFFCFVWDDRPYTGCFTTLGHNCRRWFPRSLWSKKFI